MLSLHASESEYFSTSEFVVNVWYISTSGYRFQAAIIDIPLTLTWDSIRTSAARSKKKKT